MTRTRGFRSVLGRAQGSTFKDQHNIVADALTGQPAGLQHCSLGGSAFEWSGPCNIIDL